MHNSRLRSAHSHISNASLQHMHVGSYEFDLATGQFRWSDEIFVMYGLSRERGQPSPEETVTYIHPDDAERVITQAREALDGIAPSPLEYRIIRPDGSQRVVLSEPRMEYDEWGNPTRVIGALLDITDMRRAEEERSRLVAILEATTDIVSIADTAEVILYLNPAGMRLLGLEQPEAFYGRCIADLHPPWAYQIIAQEGIPMAIKHGTWHGETAIYGHDGCEIPVSQVIISHPDSAGQVTYLSTMIRDLREYKQVEQALRESEERLRQVTEAQPQIVWLAEWSGTPPGGYQGGRMLYVSPVFEQITGYSIPQSVDVSSLWASFIHPDDHNRLIEAYSQVEQGSFECEYRIVRSDGSIRYMQDQITPIRDQEGRIYRLAGLARDITERKQFEERLLQAATVFNNTLEGVIITDPKARIIAVNRAFSEITGYSEAEALGQTPRLLQSRRHDASFYQEMWASITTSGRWQGEIWNRRKNGEIYPEWLNISAVYNEAGQLTNYIGVFSDISRVKRSEEQLAHLAHYDPLTNLPNRLLLYSRLEHALDKAKRYHHKVAVLYLDIDRFKNVNDGLGHSIGDDLLMGIANRLSERVRASDTLARLGGDEFVILLEDIQSSEEAASVAREFIGLFAQSFALVGGHEVYAGVSVGVSIGPDDADSAAPLIRNADIAMDQAKASGGNSYQFYTRAMTEAANRRLELESNLRRALERQEFVLHYQPQMDIATGQVVGVEALIRWQRPEQELIMPGLFIPVAEETGLIVAMGEWTLRHACAQMQLWRERGLSKTTLAVNLSPRQFQQQQLVEMVRSILQETGLPPDWLELEITESSVMEQPEQAMETLQALKDLGLRLAVDDFGVGYSSLAYLQRFPIDRLKIDRSFIQDLPHKTGDAAIAATIITMGHNLGLNVLAEGVEREEQLEWLRNHSCAACQGYLFSRPQAPELVAELIFPHKR